MTANEYMRKIKDNLDSVEQNLEQIQCNDCIPREIALDILRQYSNRPTQRAIPSIESIPSVTPKPKTGQYEKHIDHTDCIWYGSDSGCPVTCSQYRDGWNDAMDYIFKNGKGYQPYRHDV